MTNTWVTPFPYFSAAYKLSYFSKNVWINSFALLSIFTGIYYYVLTILFLVEPPSLDYLLGWPMLMVASGSILGFLYIFVLGYDPLLASPTTGRSWNVLGLQMLTIAFDITAGYLYCRLNNIQFYIGILTSLGVRQLGLWISYYILRRMAKHEEGMMDKGDMLAYIGVESAGDLWSYYGLFAIYEVVQHGFLFLKYVSMGPDSELIAVLCMGFFGLVWPAMTHCFLPKKKSK